MKDVIEFVFLDRKQIPFEHTDSFVFREDRPCKWLQKLCLSVLKKLGAFEWGEKETVEKYVLRPKDFMQRLFEQGAHIEQEFNREPSCVLIGGEDFQEMMACRDVQHYFSFDGSYNQGRTVIGLKIHVVPWMKGILVLPKGIV